MVNNSFFAGGSKIDGGAGNDTLTFNFAANFAPLADTLKNIETMHFGGGPDDDPYIVHLNDANVAAGATLTVFLDGPVANFLGFDETDARFHFIASTYDTTLSGGALSDLFDIRAHAVDEIHGGGGDDKILIGTGLTADDFIDGGDGNDLLVLSPSSYAGGPSIQLGNFYSVNTMLLQTGGSYDFTESASIVLRGETMTVDGRKLGAENQLSFDGSLETRGNLILIGGAGNDTLIGGHGNDKLFASGGVTNVLQGGAGADEIHCGAGADTINYLAVSDSTGAAHDTIFRFDGAVDHLTFPTSVSAVDPTFKGGSFSEASFDQDVAAAVSTLAAFHAVVWQPSYGVAILVVDTNGVTGYQAGSDFAVEFLHPRNIGLLLDS
ncbi:MAG TPA: hypothetical protein VHL34_03825 [Rhizomicrobium sp.]|jgi:Ca2+-binding RTX toxin-like protein|nr:hypothetical protein [Rhizomicrobium sp.]